MRPVPVLKDGYGSEVIQNGKRVLTRQYEFTNIHNEPVLIQEHSWGHTKAVPGHGAEPHFNIRLIDGSKINGSEIKGHYNFPR